MIQRRQALGGAEIDTKRIRSRGQWDDLMVRSRGVWSRRDDIPSAILRHKLYGAILRLAGASLTACLGLRRWSELDDASLISLSLVFLCALSLSLSLSLSLFACLSLEIICSENRSAKYFLGQSHKTHGQLKLFSRKFCFSENSIFHVQPNTRWGVKSFPEMVLRQNKRSLISY